jgi:tetratricopeptide (TPR) repeat protein
MRQIYCNRQKVEVSERTFWKLARDIAEVADTLAHTLYSGVDGFPVELGGNFTNLNWVKLEHENLQGILAGITDSELATLWQSLDQKIQEIYSLNNSLVNAIAVYFKLPVPQTKQDYKKISQRMSRSHGPVWYPDPRFQQAIRQMRQAYQEVQKIKRQIHQRVSEQLSLIEEGSAEAEDVYNILDEAEIQSDTSQGEVEIDLSDETLNELEKDLMDDEEAELARLQWVEDLIDIGNEEPDPRRAIQTFHLALRRQPTSAYAIAAYMGIAMNYEELGDKPKALENYTQAIAVDNYSNARLFFWRGELYYQLGERVKAKSDFEHALSISPGYPPFRELSQDERETVEKYLAELNKDTDKS